MEKRYVINCCLVRAYAYLRNVIYHLHENGCEEIQILFLEGCEKNGRENIILTSQMWINVMF